MGDIGPKFATNHNDNGYLAFEHVRIPRSNMLMKHAKLARDGTYSPPAAAKVRPHLLLTHVLTPVPTPVLTPSTPPRRATPP